MKFEEVYREGYLPKDIEWLPLKGYEEEFLISNYGHIKRLRKVIYDSLGRKKTFTEKIFLPKLTRNEYTRSSYGLKREYTHRLVAKNFLPNPNNYPEVNHKNGQLKFFNYAGTKKNNYSDGNLEWCDRKMNMLHASQTGLLNKTSKKRKETCRKNQQIATEKAKKKVYMYSIEGELLATFESVKIAGFLMNIPAPNIGRACRNQKYSAGGFNWSYKEN